MANWFWLARPSTLPGTMIGAHPEEYLRDIVQEWGGSEAIEHEAMEEYARCLKNPRVVRAMCEDYRAGDQIDLEHDRLDRVGNRRIECPVLVLWAEGGLTAQFGDPLAIWRAWAERVTGQAMSTGHFIMEEAPEQTIAMLTPFLKSAFERAYEGANHNTDHRRR
jgi:haloacetate dehalogenase